MPAPKHENRTYAAAHFALELDGKEGVGLFRSIEGGGVRADVMTYPMAGGKLYERWRQVGKPKFEDIKLQVGMAMGEPFYAWIHQFFHGNQDRKTGSIVAADFYYNERARRNFTNAMINELTFPKLDAADKGAAYMTVGLSVEDIQFVKGNGQKLSPPVGFDAQKMWTACNFKFEIAGLHHACQRVSKIDSFSIKQQVIEYHMGGQLSPTKTPSAVDFPNVTFYVPEADAHPFVERFSNKNQLWVQQNSKRVAHPSALHGSITTFDSQGTDLFRITFGGAEIVNVTPDRSDSSSEEIKHVKVELYTEHMQFKYLKQPDAPA